VILFSWCPQQSCGIVGRLLAERAKEAQIDGVHWVRKRGQKYHGRIAALLESMKDAGMPLV
jgi:ribosomal protein L18